MITVWARTHGNKSWHNLFYDVPDTASAKQIVDGFAGAFGAKGWRLDIGYIDSKYVDARGKLANWAKVDYLRRIYGKGGPQIP